mmetsp:Transcript_33625/g.81470  ORF Transcript_33625/g.81470 Transcript_33625/m.81470 type:complete len:1082 (-) Transcript_33625:65-3310(-)
MDHVDLFNDSSTAATPSLMNKNVSESLMRSTRQESELKLIVDNSSAMQSRRAREERDSLTINKLKTSSLGLVGRDKEASILRSSFTRMMADKTTEEPPSSPSTSNNNKEVVFIHGFSGVGKSALAKGLAKEIAKNYPNGAFVEGKFGLNSSDEPYSAVADAFGQIFSQITKTSTELAIHVAQKLSEALQDDVIMMMYLIPALDEFMADYSTSGLESSDANSDTDLKNGQQRWKTVFRIMTRVLAESLSPIVIVFDDLQWADSASLDVMEFLISDVENPNPLMIIGCYRSNEIDENSMLSHRIASLKDKCDNFRFHFAEIEVPSFGVDHVNQMIMAMLSMDEEDKTRALAEICLKRTEGNPYFLIEFMHMLRQRGLLKFNMGLLHWKWDVAKIEDATMSTPNVVFLLQSRMRKLSEEMQQLLQYAACLGASFDLSTLQLIWKEKDRSTITGGDASAISNFLQIALKENLMEKSGFQQFRWVHDKVQEAALSLSDQVDDQFRFEIGITLLNGMSPSQVEENLYDIADLINCGKTKGNKAEFAELNLKATKKARKMSAFQSAARFAAHGIDFLPSDKWEMHRQLALDLYIIGAEVELALGNAEESERYVECVISLDGITLMESLPFRLLKPTILIAQMKYDEAIDYCITLSRKLGYNIMWSRKTVAFQAVRSLQRAIKALQRAPDDFYKTTPTMTDPKDLAIVKLLRQIHYTAYISGKKFLHGLCGSILVDLTLRRGIHQFSSYSIAAVAGAHHFLKNDYATSQRFAEMALSLEDHFKGARASSTIAITYAFVMAWCIPLQNCVKPALEGYRLAMKFGKVDYAAWHLAQYYVHLPYTMGRPLGPMIAEFDRVLSQLEEFAQTAEALRLRVYWQMMLDMQVCRKGNVEFLNGEVFNSSHVKEERSHKLAKHLAEGELMLFSSNYSNAADRALKYKDRFEKKMPTFFQGMIETFHRGVSLYAMAHQTKKRRYISSANSVRKTIGKWVKKGNPNVVYYYAFLCAEHFALKQQAAKAEEKYQKAILFAARSGILHHAALFNERYADFLVGCNRDKDEIEYRLKESTRYYEEWGAKGKVQQLRKRLEEL